MNKHKAILNIGASIIGRVITLVFLILSRRLLIQYIGDEAVGLYSLFFKCNGHFINSGIWDGSSDYF